METESDKIDRSISFRQANIYSTLMLVPIFLILVIPFALIWGPEQLLASYQSLTKNFWRLILIFILGVVAHEWLHGITWQLTGKLPQNAITYGVKWVFLTPYAHLKIPVPVKTYRLGGLMPLYVLGVIPGLVGIFSGAGCLLIFGLIFSWAAIGDILVWWVLRDIPPPTMIADHPDRIGCYILVDKKAISKESEITNE